jgi:hypothetical protein
MPLHHYVVVGPCQKNKQEYCLEKGYDLEEVVYQDEATIEQRIVESLKNNSGLYDYLVFIGYSTHFNNFNIKRLPLKGGSAVFWDARLFKNFSSFCKTCNKDIWECAGHVEFNGKTQ